MRRRTLLSGLTLGATFLGPLTRGLIREAQGAPATRKRLIVFVYSNGLHQTRYRSQPRSESDFDLREIFKPLEPFKRDLIIAEPFFNPASVNLHGNYVNALTVQGSHYGTPGGVSLDRLIATKTGSQDPFTSTNLSHWYRSSAPTVSSDSAGQSFPAEWNPVRAYGKLFGSAKPGAPSVDTQLAEDRSVLDALVADVGRLNARLPGAERAKLDQYLGSLRAIETQMGALVKAQTSCDARDPGIAPMANDFKVGGEVLPEIITGFSNVTFAAQMCNLTRVSMISFSAGGEPHHLYRFLGDNIGHHKQCHDRNDAMIAKIDTYVVTQVAEFWKRLKAAPEGNGTMADNSLVMLVNTGGGIHHGGASSHAVVMLGSAGGTFRTGRYLSLANKPCIGDLYTSVANAFGVTIDKFGDRSTGPLPGLT